MEEQNAKAARDAASSLPAFLPQPRRLAFWQVWSGCFCTYFDRFEFQHLQSEAAMELVLLNLLPKERRADFATSTHFRTISEAFKLCIIFGSAQLIPRLAKRFLNLQSWTKWQTLPFWIFGFILMLPFHWILVLKLYKAAYFKTLYKQEHFMTLCLSFVFHFVQRQGENIRSWCQAVAAVAPWPVFHKCFGVSSVVAVVVSDRLSFWGLRLACCP